MQVKDSSMTTGQTTFGDEPFPQVVLLDLNLRDKAAALTRLAGEVAAVALDPAAVLKALLWREDLGSTGMGDGIAIPHASVPGLTQPFGVFARLRPPVDFAAVDDKPVDIVVLLLTPQTAKGDLMALSQVARRLRSPAFCNALRQAEDEVDVWEAWRSFA